MLLVLADDLGVFDLSAQGSQFYETPNIDRIAREGVRFTQAYAASRVCSPSRASIMTGKYTPNHGITSWIGDPAGVDWRRLGRHDSHLPAEYERELRETEFTLPEALRSAAGMSTFMAGKWHLGNLPPQAHGFDLNQGGHNKGSPPGGYFSPYSNPALLDGPPGESLPVRLGQETASFITESHTNGVPWMAYLAFYSVHAPIQTTQQLWSKYRLKARSNGTTTAGPNHFVWDRRLAVRTAQDNPVYAGVVEAMDRGVGVAMGAIDGLGIEQDTVMIFTSDK